MMFTIITISFNSENTIKRTINSILCQRCKDYEYIIIDGASKDRTVDIIKSYEGKFEGRMRWISEPDKGIYNAMNKGIRMAKGDIIGIVNSDDWLEIDSLEILNNVLQKDPENKKKILTGEMLFHYEDGTTQHYHTSYEKYEFFSKRYRMGLNHPATFVPKSVYNKIGLYDESFKLYADANFIINCYNANIGVIFINKILSNMSDGGASNSRSMNMIKDSLLMIKKHSKSRREKYWRISKFLLLWFIRGFVPERFVRYYRAKHN